ncbi:MAG: hypothetical protein DWG76_06935 [Chloroflexi bacterium]|nr:hypothetical protein [Chloroflexota bacterium]
MNPLSILANLLLLGTSVALLVGRQWRWRIVALALQYLGVFILVLAAWPLELAAVKLVSGWMAGTVLGFTRLSLADADASQREQSAGVGFRLVASGLVVLVVLGVAPGLSAWAAPISVPQAWGALLLVGMGLLNVGLGVRSLANILGLLTILSGFEILYAAIETSTLVAGLLATIHLGIALVGAYLLVAPGMDPIE